MTVLETFGKAFVPVRVKEKKIMLMRSNRVQIFELVLIASEKHDYISFEINEFENYKTMSVKLFCDMPKSPNV